jgi:hypothetical protein
MADDEARQAGEVILASAWVERDGFELHLPPAFLRLDPGDVIEVEKVSGGLSTTIRMRLTEFDLSGGWLLRLITSRKFAAARLCTTRCVSVTKTSFGCSRRTAST